MIHNRERDTNAKLAWWQMFPIAASMGWYCLGVAVFLAIWMVGYVLASIPFMDVPVPRTDTLLLFVGLTLLVVGVGGGYVLAHCQRKALGANLAGDLPWQRYTVVGVVVGLALYLAGHLWAALTGAGDGVFAPRWELSLLFGFSLGIAQWMVLRRAHRRAWLWPLLMSPAWALCVTPGPILDGLVWAPQALPAGVATVAVLLLLALMMTLLFALVFRLMDLQRS